MNKALNKFLLYSLSFILSSQFSYSQSKKQKKTINEICVVENTEEIKYYDKQYPELIYELKKDFIFPYIDPLNQRKFADRSLCELIGRFPDELKDNISLIDIQLSLIYNDAKKELARLGKEEEIEKKYDELTDFFSILPENYRVELSTDMILSELQNVEDKLILNSRIYLKEKYAIDTNISNTIKLKLIIREQNKNFQNLVSIVSNYYPHKSDFSELNLSELNQLRVQYEEKQEKERLNQEKLNLKKAKSDSLKEVHIVDSLTNILKEYYISSKLPKINKKTNIDVLMDKAKSKDYFSIYFNYTKSTGQIPLSPNDITKKSIKEAKFKEIIPLFVTKEILDSGLVLYNYEQEKSLQEKDNSILQKIQSQELSKKDYSNYQELDKDKVNLELIIYTRNGCIKKH